MVRRRTCGRAATLLRESMLGAAAGAKPSTHTRAAKASRSCEHRGARCSESHANRIAGIEETGCLPRARGQEGAASCSHLHESQRSSLLGDLVWGNDGVITGERNLNCANKECERSAKVVCAFIPSASHPERPPRVALGRRVGEVPRSAAATRVV